MAAESSEYFVDADGRFGVSVKKIDLDSARRASRGSTRGEAVDIVIVSRDNPNEIQAKVKPVIEETFEGEMQSRSWREDQLVQELRKKLGELSPNGRLLCDEQIKSACRRLANDDWRAKIVAVVSAFGDTAAPRSTLERLDSFAGRPSALDDMLKSDDVAESQFAIYCPECDLSSLLFGEQEKAETAIRDAEGRCGNCREQRLTIQQTFAISKPYVRGLQQGLWLETFMTDLMSEYSDALWTGQMIEGDEVDVVAVAFDQIFLIECKDTSFGQTDLYVSSVKAQNVGADVVLIVSTRDVHPNVSDAMQRMARGNAPRITVRSADARTFHLISHPRAEAIRAELHAFMSERSMKSLSEWATLDMLSFYF
jgi:hypothetical protein